jgi:AraC family transcriptional activator of mtrCDE
MLDRFNLQTAMELDLLDRLLNLGEVDGRLDERCELTAPWALDNARSAQREMPYHAVLCGSAVVEGPGLPPTALHAGEVLMLPSGEAHRIVDRPHDADGAAAAPRVRGGAHRAAAVTLYEARDEATVLLCGRFVLSYAAWRLYRSLLPQYVIVRAGPHDAQGIPAPERSDAASSRLSRLLALMREETDEQQPGYTAVLRNLSAALFGLTLRAAMHGEQPPSGMLALATHPRLRELAVRIVQTPSLAWTIEEMAAIANMSRSSLIRSFAAAAGMAPAEFVTRVRIAEASRLLKESEQSVAAIGEAVGYASEAAFQRAFKRETDLTPAAWRTMPLAPAQPPRPPRRVSIGGE